MPTPLPESHQPPLALRSNPPYKKTNPRHSPKSHQPQLVVRSYPAYRKASPPHSPNPTNRSWWFVHTQPTGKQARPTPRIPPTAGGGSFIPSLQESKPAPLP